MADSAVKLEKKALKEVTYDDDDEVALVTAATAPAMEDPATEDEETSEEEEDEEYEDEVQLEMAVGADGKSEAQVNGVMVLTLLDKIIGVVDQIQQTQNGLEARQEAMEKSVSGIQGELNKLSKSHTSTATTVNKMLDKVRKVSVNVKTVRSNLEKQAGQIKKLESNENELLKRRHFKVLIYQDEMKAPKVSKAKEPVAAGVAVEGLEQIPEEAGEGEAVHLNSDEEVEVEEIIEESRAERIKRSSKQRVDTIKKAFSKEQMEKTKLKTKENLEKTRLRTKENLEKTRLRTKENLEKTRLRTKENLEKTKHNLEIKMGKLGSRMTPNLERKEKTKGSKEKLTKPVTPDHAVHARNKTAVYRVPPFTFHVKKIRDGEEEEVQVTELVEPAQEVVLSAAEDGVGLHVEVEEGELVNVGSPEMEAVLEVAEDSPLVLVETDNLKKASSE